MGCMGSKSTDNVETMKNRPATKAKVLPVSTPIVLFFRENACPSGKTVTLKFKLAQPHGAQRIARDNEAFFYNGQYGLFQFMTNPRAQVRQYTMWHDPQAGFDVCCITVKRVPDGAVSPYLHSLQVATSQQQKLYNCSGFFHWPDLHAMVPVSNAHSLVMVAGGAGVVPMYALLLDLFETPMAATLPPHDVVLFYSEKCADDLCFLPTLRKWVAAASPHGHKLTLRLHTTRETAEGCQPGRISAKTLKEHCADVTSRYILTCGPGDFHDNLVQQCKAADIKGPFFTELFVNTP
eukprot:TRINITY_DN1203_c0_g2_i1.p1 TRINITY_DN1203_c0_g2~~TRINITY_DN1203_c0_g2_i1.p1  ORF type:complete len:323 (+),score=95.57 TRINITY_DN1203_c0_g2_i1:93-971(+)